MDLCVFLSDRCNLLCGYCTILLNEGKAHYLTAEQVCRGVDAYMAGTDADQERSVVYLGGEPLLKWDVLTASVEHIAKRHPRARQHLYTNGVLLTAERWKWLQSKQVSITISMDGKKGTNDRYRVFWKSPKRSAWREVMERLREVPAHAMGVNQVFTPDTVHELVDNTDFMRRAGFRIVDFNPDTCNKRRIQGWDAAALGRLAGAATALRGYFEGLARRGELTFTSPHLAFFPKVAAQDPARAWWHRFESTILGADGNFYPCESLFQFPYETLADFRIGSAETGLDRDRQEAFALEARRAVTGWFGDRRHYSCPMNVYIYSRRAGEDGRALIEGMMRVFETLSAPLIEFDREHPGLLATPGVVR